MIGVPEAGPFKPDPFQLEALALIRENDVLVSAPTGAGKTWIASQAIHSYRADDLRVWYASPLKALSNSIYQGFCREFGAARCGILTGDRKENPDAPIIVGTTEILRNQLYDAMSAGIDISTDLVILDEAHYLSDPDRGVVWEEVLIYLPPRVRLLLLSATISNAEEICAWLTSIRGTPNRVVRSNERPVPLETLFIFPDGLLAPLQSRRGLSPMVKRYISSKTGKGRRRREKIDYGRIIRVLREFNLLPAIFFLKSRKDCDLALLTCPPVGSREGKRTGLKQAVREFVKDHPHLQAHRQMNSLIDSAVASHHGGQLPYWKVLVEKMMNKGRLEAIFSTSTVAAGVNFPARTVVLVQSDRYNGREFVDLTATDLQQMIGRAGRRGKDQIGFALVVPGIHQDPKLIQELRDSPAEPLSSQIHINFSMTLNLLLSQTPNDVKDLLDRSFAAFQEEETDPSLKAQWRQVLWDLKNLLPKARCHNDDPYEILELIQQRSELQRELGTTARKKNVPTESIDGIKRRLKALPCEMCAHHNLCHRKKKGPIRRVLGHFRGFYSQIEGLQGGLWLSFRRHLRFLKETGFVDESDRLTPEGLWAAKLRLDQPLLIAEAIRKAVLDGIPPEFLAGGLAPFVWDRELEVSIGVKKGFGLNDLEGVFDALCESIEPIRTLKRRRGFSSPPILFWPAVALYLWARGVPWDQLLTYVPIDEGDMASLIMRTADHLRQVVNLRETHTKLAHVAEESIALVLREPVYMD